jgi:hypothetical protein
VGLAKNCVAQIIASASYGMCNDAKTYVNWNYISRGILAVIAPKLRLKMRNELLNVVGYFRNNRIVALNCNDAKMERLNVCILWQRIIYIKNFA